MIQYNENWERIYAVITYAQMTTNYFARHIGLPCGENLYRIKRGSNGISRDVAERIVAKYPEISKAWILTGQGSMFTNEAQQAAQIPFFDGDAAQVLAMYPDPELKPLHYLFVPPLCDCDLAVAADLTGSRRKKTEKNIFLVQKIKDCTLSAGSQYIAVKENSISLHKLPKRPKCTSIDLNGVVAAFVVKGIITLNEN